MLTTFYFDSELFDDKSLQLIAQLNISLLESWQHYGCLGICASHKKEILASINKVPPKYSVKWQTALSQFKNTVIKPSIVTISDYDSFDHVKDELVKQNVTTGIIATDYADDFKGYDNPDKFEIVSPVNFGESKNFEKSKSLCLKQIKNGDDINTIWDERFKNLALHTKGITIIDRFSALNILEDHKLGKRTALDKFIEFLSTTGKKYEITIFGACDINGKMTNATDLKSYLDNVLRKKPFYNQSVVNCSFALCKNRFFGQEAHDRMIRLDDYVFEIGNGIDIFREKPISNNSFTIKPLTFTNFEDIYIALNRNREPGCTSL